MEVVYSLRDVWVFYVMYDDSRIINVKHLNFKSDSQVIIFAFRFICVFFNLFMFRFCMLKVLPSFVAFRPYITII